MASSSSRTASSSAASTERRQPTWLRITVQPPLTLTATPESDGRVRLTPVEPLTPGAVYRFTLAGSDGQTLDSWAFQARQPLRVISTVPADTQTDVPRDTGIEITFDQDGGRRRRTHFDRAQGRGPLRGARSCPRIRAANRLAAATIYTVTIRRGVKVKATGEILEEDVRFQFETTPAKDAAPRKTTFRFANDLFESATADRPTLWSFVDVRREDGARSSTACRWRSTSCRTRPPPSPRSGHLRSTPTWSQWSADRVSDAGLRRVARLDAHLEDTQGTLWTRLPEPLPAGWYLVQYPSAERPAQAVLQVTDIASYLLVSETDTLLWGNDLASGDPIVDATVSTGMASLGRTGPDGTLLGDAPAAHSWQTRSLVRGRLRAGRHREFRRPVGLRAGDRCELAR